MRRINLDRAACIGDENGEAIYVLKKGEKLAILGSEDRVLRSEDLEDYEKLITIKMRFVKVNAKAYKELGNKYPLISLLLELIQYQTGKIVYKNGTPINRTNLSKACGVSPSTVDRQLKGLIEEDVIKIVRDGRDSVFFFNPYVAHLGKKVNLSLVELFRDSRFKDYYEKTLGGKKR